MTDQVDPWCNGTVEPTEDEKKGFKDNFVVKEDDADRLPDHEDYLNKLETKLDRLKKKSSISKELALRRSDEARRMLESSAAAIEVFEDEELDEQSAISRRLFPEKQALSVSEIARLLESDTLDKSVQEDEEPTNNDAKDCPTSELENVPNT